MIKRIAGSNIVTGVVTELDVGGQGGNSGQLEFVVTNHQGVNTVMVVEMDTEARVFTAMAAMLAVAYQNGITVTASYGETAGETPKAFTVTFPPKH